MPDWVDAKDRDQRLWSGVDRVVVVKGPKEGERASVVRREVEKEAHDKDKDQDRDKSKDDEKNIYRRKEKEREHEIHQKAVFYVSYKQQPQYRHSLSQPEQPVLMELSISATSTLDPGPISTFTVPRPGESYIIKGYQISNTLWGFIFLVAVVVSFISLVMIYFYMKLVRKRQKTERAQEEA